MWPEPLLNQAIGFHSVTLLLSPVSWVRLSQIFAEVITLNQKASRHGGPLPFLVTHPSFPLVSLLTWRLDEATIPSCGILQRFLAASHSCLHCSTLACGKKDFAHTEQVLQSSHFPPACQRGPFIAWVCTGWVVLHCSITSTSIFKWICHR